MSLQGEGGGFGTIVSIFYLHKQEILSLENHQMPELLKKLPVLENKILWYDNVLFKINTMIMAGKCRILRRYTNKLQLF